MKGNNECDADDIKDKNNNVEDNEINNYEDNDEETMTKTKTSLWNTAMG